MPHPDYEASRHLKSVTITPADYPLPYQVLSIQPAHIGQFNPHTSGSIQPAQVVNSTRTGFFWIFRGLYLKNERTYHYEIFSKDTSQDSQHV